MPDIAPLPMDQTGSGVGVHNTNNAAAGSPDAQKAQLDALVRTILARAGQGQQSMPQPRQQFSQESMTKNGYNMSAAQNNKQDIGIALQNFATFIHNGVAQHKQNQQRDAMNEWQGFNTALEKAQVLAGDPNDPKYKEKMQQALQSDPWVKANLDPSNPKSVKRLKNMYKALNVDLTDDKENVHRSGLKQMFKVNAAFDKVKQLAGKKQEHQQQSQYDKTKQMTEAVQRLMSRTSQQQTDPKQQMEAARIGQQQQQAEEGTHNLDNMWLSQFKKENNRDPNAHEIEAHQQNKSLKPVDQHIQKAMDAASSGDWKTADEEFKIAHQGAEAKRISPPSTWEVIGKANKGDKDSQAMLAKDIAMRKEIAMSYGAGRAAYNMNNYFDENGTPIAISALDASRRIKAGEKLTYAGALSTAQVASFQRLKAEATPAITEVNKFIGAFDNAQNRAVFARVLGNPPEDEAGFTDWAKTAMDQALKGKELDSDGRQLAVRLRRLADTMGTLRSALGLTATDASMRLLEQLMPGPSTPDSKMAKDIMDQLSSTVDNAVDIPLYKNIQKNQPKRVFTKGDAIPKAPQ